MVYSLREHNHYFFLIYGHTHTHSILQRKTIAFKIRPTKKDHITLFDLALVIQRCLSLSTIIFQRHSKNIYTPGNGCLTDEPCMCVHLLKTQFEF